MDQNDDSPYQAPESDVVHTAPSSVRRKDLIPLWIKIFGWLFLVGAVLTPIIFLYSFLTVQPISLAMFGLEYYGPATNPFAGLMFAIFVFLGVTAFGLLFERDWGVNACLANGYIGLAICVFVFIASGFTSIRLEPVVHFFYLHRLHKIRKPWAEAGT